MRVNSLSSPLKSVSKEMCTCSIFALKWLRTTNMNASDLPKLLDIYARLLKRFYNNLYHLLPQREENVFTTGHNISQSASTAIRSAEGGDDNSPASPALISPNAGS